MPCFPFGRQRNNKDDKDADDSACERKPSIFSVKATSTVTPATSSSIGADGTPSVDKGPPKKSASNQDKASYDSFDRTKLLEPTTQRSFVEMAAEAKVRKETMSKEEWYNQNPQFKDVPAKAATADVAMAFLMEEYGSI